MLQVEWPQRIGTITPLLRSVGTTALVATLVFSPLVHDWTGFGADQLFFLWLVTGFALETILRQLNRVLPSYWFQTARSLCVLPFIFNDLPSCLQDLSTLSFFRALHVGLLTSRGGYGIDLRRFREDRSLTSLLVTIGLLVEGLTTGWALLALGACSQMTAILIATVVPAPTAEIGEPVFRLVSNAHRKAEEPADPEAGREQVAHKDRVPDVLSELERVRALFRTTTLPSTVLTILLFSSVASVVHPPHHGDVRNFSNDTELYASLDVILDQDIEYSNGKHLTSDPNEGNSQLRRVTSSAFVIGRLPIVQMATNAAAGLAAVAVFSLVTYALGRLLLVPRKSSSSNAVMAVVVFFTGVFSMIHIGGVFPVAAALGAISACLSLRLATGFDERTAKRLSKVWPHTSAVYYISFAYITVAYFCSVSSSVLGQTEVLQYMAKFGAASILAFVTKFIVSTALCRCFRLSWQSCALLGATLNSKGTVQMALVTMIPLKLTSLRSTEDFLLEAMLPQLFVLVNYMVVCPCIYAIAVCIRCCGRRR